MKILNKKDYTKIGIDILKENPEVLILKDFVEQNLCQEAVRESHLFMKQLPNRVNKDGKFFSFDLLPTKVETDRIFRTLEITKFNNSDSSLALKQIYDRLYELQINSIVNNQEDLQDQTRRFQIIHYPIGGGFFDWHLHPRFPVNYGMILNLSKKNINFKSGGTEIKDLNGKIIKVEDYSDIGDLILFRNDLKHRVSPCDPSCDLTFDQNGRWTAIMPIY